MRATSVTRADVILVTHAHLDHFLPGETAIVAEHTGARVVGPATVIDALKGKLPPESLIEMEPPRKSRQEPAASVHARLGAVAITAFRTFHGRDHNSYLVEMPGFRFLHDGDNEDTRMLPPDALGRLDALFIGPWQGSGWDKFVDKVKPAKWFLMHLTTDELKQHDEGKFLPPLCRKVPLPDSLSSRISPPWRLMIP